MSLACRPALRTSLRCLHTSARVYNESSSSAPTGASLGFGDYTGRTRKLPTIPISPSSQRNVLRSRAPKASSSTEQKAKKETGKPRQIRQGRSPAQTSARQAKSQGTESEVTAGEDEFFGDVAPRARGSGMEKVDMDFSAPVKIASAGKSRGKGRASTSTPSTRERRARAPVVPEVEDRSPEGIFGRASLLFPVRRGAREAERSVWAENLQPADARKAEMSRLAGSASVYLPDKPLPTELTGKNASQASKMLGSWLLSINPGVSMRRAKGAEAVINSYLK